MDATGTGEGAYGATLTGRCGYATRRRSAQSRAKRTGIRRFLPKAIDYEVDRQIAAWKRAEESAETRSGKSASKTLDAPKEEAPDIDFS